MGSDMVFFLILRVFWDSEKSAGCFYRGNEKAACTRWAV
jgi:hypothetical protein